MDKRTLVERNFSTDDNVKNFYSGRVKSLLFIHILLELLYIWLGCTPMIFINILSIAIYFFYPKNISFEKKLLAQLIVLIEVFLHSCLDCYFFGKACGFQFWLFGTFCSMYIPFLDIWLNKTQIKVYKCFRFFVCICFLYFTWPYTKWVFQSVYAPNDKVASILYAINALFAFSAISSYSGFYIKVMEKNVDDLFNLASHDSLTGLYSRQYLIQIMEDEINKQKEAGEYTLCVAILDIDFFKKINDSYGHLAGDTVLKEVGYYLKELEKDDIYAGRYGGEEFIIFSANPEGYEKFCSKMNTLNISVQNHRFIVGSNKVHITVSIGTAEFTSDSTMEEFIKKADDNLYIAKESGRNLVVS